MNDLMTAFGDHLCRRFSVRYPESFRSHANLFDFIESIDRHIHVEVHKLYPDAELPRFSTRARDARILVIDYSSCRPLASLAEGMIKAAALHFSEVVTVERAPVTAETGAAAQPGERADRDRAVRFTLTRAA